MTLKSARDLQKENAEQKSVYLWGLNNYLQCGDSSEEEQVYFLKKLQTKIKIKNKD